MRRSLCRHQGRAHELFLGRQACRLKAYQMAIDSVEQNLIQPVEFECNFDGSLVSACAGVGIAE